jgi:hypothetical protein
MTQHTVSLHLSKFHTSHALSTLYWLACEHIDRSSLATALDLVLSHVIEALVECHPYGDGFFELLTSCATAHGFTSTSLKLTPAQESRVHPRKQNEKDLEVLRVLEV